MKKIWIILWVLGIGLGISAQSVFAGDKFIIKPIIMSSYEIDSNFYKTNTNERSVSTLTVSPGLEFGYRTEKSKVAARGMINAVYYDDLNSVPAGKADSDNNDYTGHSLTLSADTQLYTRITMGLDDTWINTRNPSELDRFDNFTDINEYMINRVRPWVKYKITDRISAGFEFNHASIEYNAAGLEDSSNTGGKINLYYEMSRFTIIDLEYSLKKMDYGLSSSDYDSNEYRVNFASGFKYFKFSGGLGYHKRDFDQAGLNDMETLSWDLSIKGRNPPDTSSGDRPRSYIDIGFAQNFNDTGNGDEYYRADRFSLIMGHLFMEKIDVKLNAYYQKSEYEGSLSNRQDDTYFFSSAISYFMNEWLTLNLSAGIETRDSSIAANDYDNTFVIFRITFNYNLGSK